MVTWRWGFCRGLQPKCRPGPAGESPHGRHAVSAASSTGTSCLVGLWMQVFAGTVSSVQPGSEGRLCVVGCAAGSLGGAGQDPGATWNTSSFRPCRRTAPLPVLQAPRWLSPAPEVNLEIAEVGLRESALSG